MTSSGKILVTGATGNVGSAVIANLTSMGVSVRALVRNDTKARDLEDAGVEVAIGDLEKPETLDAAFMGVDKVFLLTAVGPNAVTQASNGIAAAKRAGGLYTVRLSAVKAAPDSPTRIGRLHAETEDELKASGLPYTILKPHFYMQNTLMAAETVASDGVFYMPFKDGNLGIIDIRDIAAVAAKVLTQDGHEGKTYTPTGPASISFHDVASGLRGHSPGKSSTWTSPSRPAGRRCSAWGSGSGVPTHTASTSRSTAKAGATSRPMTSSR